MMKLFKKYLQPCR